MSGFTSSGLKRNRSGPERSPPIPITRTVSEAMNIPGVYGGRTPPSSSKTISQSKYSQSVPLPRAPIIGSLPTPTSMRFEQMPTLELPPSFKDDEIVTSFGAPGTSLGSNHRGYAASCPAVSFMGQASRRSQRSKEDGGRGSSGEFGESDAQTPSYNTPSMGSRTILSVLLETDETEDGTGGGSFISSNHSSSSSSPSTNSTTTNSTTFTATTSSTSSVTTNMEMPINLQKLDLSSPTKADGASGSLQVVEDEEMDMPEDIFSDDDDGLFQMDTE